MRYFLLFLVLAQAILFQKCTSPLPKGKDVLLEQVVQKKEERMPEKVIFPSLDSLNIYANFYKARSPKATIVLCHQAGFNKVEYIKSALVLIEQGFHCLAIDQRSGDAALEWFNETKLEADRLGKTTKYLDAEQDIKAAVLYAAKEYKLPVILVGSSYSATLSLAIAAELEEVYAVLAFSPGNYFEEKNTRLGLAAMLNALGDKPFWISSSKEEAAELLPYLRAMKLNPRQLQFVPEADGTHGARALWQTDPSHKAYWAAMIKFLKILEL